MEYFIAAIRNYATFSGRASRKEYWMFSLFYWIFYVVLIVLETMLGSMALTWIFTLFLFVPCISIAARRLHDTGRSGWWQLIALVPVIGFIVLIVFLVQDSVDDNDHGINPKSAGLQAALRRM